MSAAARQHAGEDWGVSPLSLFAEWVRGAPGFARPAPPGAPLPLRFRCRDCRALLNPRRPHSCPARH